MDLKAVRCFAVAVTLAVAFAAPSVAEGAPAPTASEMEEFLLNADIVDSTRVGGGATRPWRLTLSDGQITHDALFQPVEIRRDVQRFPGRVELQFADSYHFNIAAYQLAGLLGLGDMIPVTVERRWQGKKGALTWWVDDVAMDERTRLSNGVKPPNYADWDAQLRRMHVFGQLVHDTDRNQHNILYGPDWRVWMIDFTRAFRVWGRLLDVNTLVKCDRDLLERLQSLDKDEVKAAVGRHLTKSEIKGLMERRDLVVARFEELVAERSADAVLY